MTDMSLPAQKETPPSRSFVPISIIAVTLLLLGGFGWYFGTVFSPTARPVALMWKMLTLPAELRDATFISEDAYYSRGPLGLGIRSASADPIVSFAHSEEKVALLTKSDSGEYNVTLDGEKIFSTTTQLAQLSIAPNGSYLAFTEPFFAKQAGSVDAPLGSIALLPAFEKNVAAYSLATRAHTSIGVGAAPVFYDETHIIRRSNRGLVMKDINSGAETLLVDKSSAVLQGEVLISRDRSLIALTDRIEKKMSLYRISNGAFTLAHQLEVDFIIAAIGDNEVYEVRSNGGDYSVVWAHPYDGSAPREVVALPSYLGVTTLSL